MSLTNGDDPRLKYVAKSGLAKRQQGLSALPAAPKSQIPPQVKERQAVVLAMHRAGVTLITGTDASYLHPPGFSLHDELDMLVEAGLTPAEALRAGTLNSANLFPSLGASAIAPGKRADLVLLNGNPLTDIRNVHDIRGRGASRARPESRCTRSRIGGGGEARSHGMTWFRLFPAKSS